MCCIQGGANRLTIPTSIQGRVDTNNTTGMSIDPNNSGGNRTQDSVDPSASGSASTMRQQQYIIVQTTGSNGMPTNIAVPANLLISPQGQLILNNGEDGGKSRPRASSAPPVQNNLNANNIMLSSGPSTGNNIQMPMTICQQGPTMIQNVNQQLINTVNVSAAPTSISSQQSSGIGNSYTLGTPKHMSNMSIPTLEIQDSGTVRVSFF